MSDEPKCGLIYLFDKVGIKHSERQSNDTPPWEFRTTGICTRIGEHLIVNGGLSSPSIDHQAQAINPTPSIWVLWRLYRL